MGSNIAELVSSSGSGGVEASASDEPPLGHASCQYCSCSLPFSEGASHWEEGIHYVVHRCASCARESWTRVELNDFNPGGFFETESVMEPLRRKVPLR